jgi:hypothetical protein
VAFATGTYYPPPIGRPGLTRGFESHDAPAHLLCSGRGATRECGRSGDETRRCSACYAGHRPADPPRRQAPGIPVGAIRGLTTPVDRTRATPGNAGPGRASLRTVMTQWSRDDTLAQASRTPLDPSIRSNTSFPVCPRCRRISLRHRGQAFRCRRCVHPGTRWRMQARREPDGESGRREPGGRSQAGGKSAEPIRAARSTLQNAANHGFRRVSTLVAPASDRLSRYPARDPGPVLAPRLRLPARPGGGPARVEHLLSVRLVLAVPRHGLRHIGADRRGIHDVGEVEVPRLEDRAAWESQAG